MDPTTMSDSFPLEKLSDSPMRYELLKDLQNMLQKSRSRVEEACRTFEKREGILSDYLRDTTIHKSTVANLSLQKRITTLTLVAVLIAFVSLLITFLPESIKAEVQKFIANILRLEK